MGTLTNIYKRKIDCKSELWEDQDLFYYHKLCEASVAIVNTKHTIGLLHTIDNPGLDLAQFPVTEGLGRGPRSGPPSAPALHILCLYQASSMVGGCNLARFGSP